MITYNELPVVTAYRGKFRGCMCGCRGKYWFTADMAEQGAKRRGYAVTPDEIDDDRVEYIVARVRFLARKYPGYVTEDPGHYIAVDVPHQGRSYVLYFK